MNIIEKYFPELTETQKKQFADLQPIYEDWNAKVNVISRKDIEHFYERHVLHSLGLAKIITFKPGTSVLDLGTGGGFPGIPLAILFPEVKFHLTDSIAKKIKVVEDVIAKIDLKNTTCRNIRAEKLDRDYDFVITRGVGDIKDLFQWSKPLLKKEEFNDFDNGIFAYKGGDLKEEFLDFGKHRRFYDLKDYFDEEFFETKKIVFVKK